ncbi:MAG: ferredoxin [Alphaproteobacteria bacterium]|nr:MAG: ferredoxin [Alphaproteobacteria bacterium]
MSHRIRFEGLDEVFECRNNESVLVAMERLGLAVVPVGCRGGGCGVCKVRVLDGWYHTGKMSRAQVTEQEEREGYALACRLYPDGPLVLQAIGKLVRVT